LRVVRSVSDTPQDLRSFGVSDTNLVAPQDLRSFGVSDTNLVLRVSDTDPQCAIFGT